MKTQLLLLLATMLQATALAQWTRPVPIFSDMVLDGTTEQYLYNIEAKSFLLGANDWNTRASLSSERGYKMRFVSSTNQAKTSLVVGDSAINVLLNDYVETTDSWRYYFCESFSSIWCDGNNSTGYDTWKVKCISSKRYNISNETVPGTLFGWAPYAGDSTNTRCYMLDYTQTSGGNPLFDRTKACTTWAVVSAADYKEWQGYLETYLSAMTLGDYIANAEATYEGIDLTAPKAVYNNTSSTKANLDAALNQAKELVTQYRFGDVVSGGVDCTEFIVNPSFEEDTEGWTYNSMSVQSNNSFTLKSGTKYMERWVSTSYYVGTASVSQTLTGLPAGTYRLAAAAQNTQQSTPDVAQTGAWLFAGDERTAVAVADTYSVVFSHVSGDVTIGFEATGATGNWIAVDNFTLTYYGDSIILPSYINNYNLAVDAAKVAIADEANAGASDEIAALQALIDAEMPATPADIDAAREAIETATDAVISAAVVKNYARIMAAYPINISYRIPELGTWAGELTPLSSQHWDGTSTSIYYEQTSEQWLQSAWTNSKSMSAVFPSGKYAICMAGRSASGGGVRAYLKVNDVEVVFPAKGDVGLGIDVNGAATMSPSATYANNGLGRGWEYRYVEFESDGQTPTYITFGGVASAPHQWMSFTEPQFLTTSDNDGYEVYTYLTNADFTVDAPETVGIRTYAKDATADGDKAQAQPVTGWTVMGLGDAQAAGTFEYGSNAFLGGNGYNPPSAGPDGKAGQALGIMAVWAATTQYTQQVTLPAGDYTFNVTLYNAGGTGTITSNLFGVDGSYFSTTYYPVGQWVKESMDFSLAEEKAVTVSLGYKAGNAGSGSMPHLFVDNVSLFNKENTDTISHPAPIALLQPTFNVESGTSGYPNILPAGSSIKLNFQAENLVENGLKAEDVSVKANVRISGGRAETRSSDSPTAHNASGTYYLPLGEVEFPIPLKPSYYYETIAVTDAQLVTTAEDGREVVLATCQDSTLAGINNVVISPLIFSVDGISYKQTSGNLFTNGSFDTGVYGWKTINYTTEAKLTNFAYSTRGGFDGGAYITTNGAGVGSEMTIRQSTAVEPGKQYYFTVYTSGKAPDSQSFNYNALFQMTDAKTENGVLKAFEWPQGAAQTATEWSQTEFVFTAATNCRYVGVRMGWNTSSSFDGFALYEVNRLTSELEIAKTAALYELDALPTGDGYFLYPQAAIDQARQSIEEAQTTALIQVILANVKTSRTLPEEGKTYLVKNVQADLNLGIGTSKVSLTSRESPVFFTAVNDSSYALSNTQGEYIFKTASNSWSLSTTTDADQALALTFHPAEGGLTIQSRTGLLGTDSLSNNAALYANKKVGATGTLWLIEEYEQTEEPPYVSPYELAADTGLNVADLGELDIDWKAASDAGAVAEAVGNIDWANVEVIRMPANSGEHLAPYLDKNNAPKLREVIVEDNGTVPLSAVTSVSMNPNCMIRLSDSITLVGDNGQEAEAPANIFTGRRAKSVVLTDGYSYRTAYIHKDGNYWAESIRYTRSFGKSTSIGQSSGWETLVLPFDVSRVTAADGRRLVPFGSGSEGDAYFWLAELTDGGFQQTTSIKAGRPYIIAMPNSPEYDPQYNITGEVTFSATNDSLYPSRQVASTRGGNMVLNPTYLEVSINDGDDIFVINDDTYQNYLPGGAFVRNLRAPRPFEAYVTQSTTRAKRRDAFAIEMSLPTGMESLLSGVGQDGQSVIYDLTGRRVAVPARGLYIKNGRKVLVK